MSNESYHSGIYTEMIKMTMRKLFVFILSLLLLNTISLRADVTGGNTGDKNTVVNKDPILSTGGTNFQISGGLQYQNGSNLFHTFGNFSISSQDVATFTSKDIPEPSKVQNILARVAGNDLSNIDGTIKSEIGEANLYLINPHGIIFGRNAKLEVPGSFHATTADYMRLGKDGRFYASLSRESTFSTAPPEAFGFLDKHPISSISVKDSFLKVPVGKQLSLISGGKVEMDNGIAYAPGGRIDVVAAVSAGEVEPTPSGLQVSSTEKGEIIISHYHVAVGEERDYANLDVTDYDNEKGAGQIFIRGGKFVANKSWLFADRYEGESKSPSIDISIDGDMELINGARITADNNGSGTTGGLITITAKNSLRLSGYDERREDINQLSTIATNTFSSGSGGDITITTPILEMNPGAILADAGGEGKSGNITLNVTDTVSLEEQSQISARSLSAGGGNIIIQGLSNHLYLVDSFISASTKSQGAHDAGNLDIGKPKFIILNRGQLFARAIQGDGGNINVNSDYFVYSNPYQKPSGVFEKSIDRNISRIDASSDKGIYGKVWLKTREWKFGDFQWSLPRFEVAKLSLSRCASFSKDNPSRFIITARDILPRCPEDLRTQTIRLWR